MLHCLLFQDLDDHRFLDACDHLTSAENLQKDRVSVELRAIPKLFGNCPPPPIPQNLHTINQSQPRHLTCCMYKADFLLFIFKMELWFAVVVCWLHNPWRKEVQGVGFINIMIKITCNTSWKNKLKICRLHHVDESVTYGEKHQGAFDGKRCLFCIDWLPCCMRRFIMGRFDLFMGQLWYGMWQSGFIGSGNGNLLGFQGISLVKIVMYFVGSVLWWLCCVGVHGFGRLTVVICVLHKCVLVFLISMKIFGS